MLAPWVIEEMETADLGDKRLNKRLAQVLSAFAERPTASIPAACGGHAEMMAAYRLFDNDKVTFAKILQSHVDKTLVRVAAQPIALLVQDTTEIDLTHPELDVAGAGPLAEASRRGVFLHPLHAFTPDGTPLGTAWAKVWAREDEPDLTQAQKRKRRKAAPIEEKESVRWLEGLRAGRGVAEVAPETTCVCISDSESDIYELFVEPRQGVTGQPVEWLVRACQDRGLIATEAASETARLRDAALAAPVLFTQEISVRGRTPKTACDDRARRQARRDRKAFVSIRATAVTLRPPARPGQKLPPVTVNLVLVREEAPPEGEEPIEWLLVTTISIETTEHVRSIIAYYTVRWMIELLFRTLKSGCRVEKRRFEHVDRLLPCVALYLIVAWRTLLVCRMGRSCPDISCEAIFEPAEWQSVYVTVQKKPIPTEPPSLETMVRLIAQLGGYVNRANRKDPPGVQTIWLGMQRMQDLALGWVSFGPGARAKLM